ncbi:MAG: hypothetical protein D6794_02980 [Deltaproteobacteria bacterium]|nr:MAG: hypothetical protein D6794_02980 [Deltaproteobacteria bacterium]
MALLRRCYLGVDISARELKAVAMQRHGHRRLVTGARLLQLPEGLVRPGSREPICDDCEGMARRLHELVAPLARGEERVALALPDSCGRQLLTEVEAPFSSHREGIDILRWQLKAHLPGAPQDVQLDYQVLGQQENGRYRVLVAMVNRAIVEQIEQVFAEAGLQAVLIDFHSAQLYNWYSYVADLGGDTVLLAIEGGTFSIRCLVDHRTVFVRCRDLEPDAALMFQEMNRSLAGTRETQHDFSRARVCLHTDWQNPDELLEAAASVFESEVQLLDPRFDRDTEATLDLAAARLKGLAAAAGAAERMIG